MAKTNVGEVFDKILASAKGKRPVPEEKPFWREHNAKDDEDQSDDVTNDGEDDEEEDSREPQSFADKVKKARLDGTLSGNPVDDEEDDSSTTIRKKKKKVKKSKPQEDDTSYEDEVDIRIPKKPKKDEAKKQKEQDEEEEQESEDKTEKEGEEKADKEEKEDDEPALDEESQKKLDEALAVKEEGLTNRLGQPVGEQASKVIKRLKNTIKYFADKAKKAQKKSDIDPQLPNDFKQIKEAHEALKKKYELKYFQETPEWKNKFDKPLDDAALEAAKWIRSHDHADDSDELVELEQHRNAMQKALKEKDDVKYYEHSDAIAEYLKKGAGSRFQNAVPKLWDAYWAREEALKNAEEAAKSVTEDTESFLTSKIKEAGSNLDAMIENFEQTNAKIINVYKTKPGIRDVIDYENVVTKRLGDTKKLLDQAIRNRAIPAELQKIIFSGVLASLKDKEMEGLREALRQEKEAVARLEKQVEKKEQSLKKIKPSKTVTHEDSDDEDDDEDDKIESFTDYYKKKTRQMA